MPPLDHDRCYAAASSRDARFDGQFITAVKTTGIYCRPSCPAVTPKSANVEFFHTAGAAQQRGFRACKRCLPDATPGSPDWDRRHDVVARAMRLIADGVVERDGVGAIAARLGYSERQVNRLMTDELGAGPLAIARAQRAQLARQLVETSDMTLTDVAFAAGFGSVRQFNATMREVFDSSPSDLRATARRRRGAGSVAPAAPAPTVSLRLPTRRPFDLTGLMVWLASRCVPGVELFADGRYHRSLRLPSGPATIEVTAPDEPEPDHVVATLRPSAWSDLAPAVQRLRRLLDLDADPVAIDAHLRADATLRRPVESRPGVRVPGTVDPFETIVRAVIGQQVSVAAARTVTAGLVEAVGDVLPAEHVRRDVHRLFPSADAVAGASDVAFSMPTARRDTLRRVASAVAAGDVPIGPGVDPGETRERLLEITGIGPWTAGYVAMRAGGDPDVMLATDLGVRHGAAALGIEDIAAVAETWAPWRSYASHHLWAAAPDPSLQRKART
ncbi:MAG: AlkA N-terminal domain-containing protein [Ilumatobacter sp.]